jgi:hypothetical protein
LINTCPTIEAASMAIHHDLQDVVPATPGDVDSGSRLHDGAGSRRRVFVWSFAVALLVTAALAGWAPLTSPGVRRLDAPAAEFSAGRALVQLRAISTQPHPMGSPAAAEVRDHIAGVLRDLGLDPRLSSSPVCRGAGTEPVCGQAHNIVATVDGSRGDGAVMLVAHYDSVMGGPGASDDGLGVASLLEVARALTAGDRPVNDVVLIFTDGEEQGLLGATAIVDAGLVPAPDRSVVLNLDARGQYGPVAMFQTGVGRAGAVSALGDHPPVATSAAGVVYALLPNDTDFSAFVDAGYTGLNFAVMSGSARYHTELDTVDHVDPSALQDMGETVLAATRQLAAADLAAVAGAGAATYFPVGPWLVAYPAWLAMILAILALVVVAFAVVLAFRRSVVTARGILVAGLGILMATIAAALVGAAGWALLRVLRPDYAGFVAGDPYRPEPGYAGFALLGIALLAGAAAAGRRRVRPADVLAAILVIFTALTAAALVLAPGATYAFAWPALLGGCGLAVVAHRPSDRDRFAVAAALGGAAALVTLTPIAVLLFPVLGLGLVGAILPIAVVSAAAVGGPLIAAAPRRALTVVAGVLALCGAVLVGVETASDRPSAATPRQISLIYAVDADTGTAEWLSPYPEPDGFVDHYVVRPGEDRSQAFPLLHSPRYRSGPAAAVPVPTPVARLESDDRQGDRRTLRIRLSADGAAATATRLALYVDTRATPVLEARVAGEPVAGGENRTGADPWGWGVSILQEPSGSTVVEVVTQGTGPVRLRVLAQSSGLPVGAMDRPMPDDTASAMAPSVQTLAARTVVW